MIKIVVSIVVIYAVMFQLGCRQYLDPICLYYTFNSSSFNNIQGIRYRCGGAYSGVDPSISSDNKKIVFGCTLFGGYGDICLINSDGSGLTQLTNTKEYDGQPSFSPNVDKIVFVSERDKSPNIYIMDSDGSNQKPLTKSDLYKSSPSFSPDGEKIIYVGENESDCKGCNCSKSQIITMNIDGSEPEIIRTDDRNVSLPSYSPSGKQIVFYAYYCDDGKLEEGLKVLTIDSGGSRVLVKKGYPVGKFSMDGENIIFSADFSDGESPLQYLIYNYNLASGEIKKMSDYEGTRPSYYDDDNKVLFFQRKNRHGGDVSTINSDGTGFKVVTKTY